MQFEKMPPEWEPAWMKILTEKKLAWYFAKDGKLLFTKKAKRAADRGGWTQVTDTEVE